MHTGDFKQLSSDVSSHGLRGLCVLAQKEKVYIYYNEGKKSADSFRVALSIDGFSFVRQSKSAILYKGMYTRIPITSCGHLSFSRQDTYFDLIFTHKNNKKSFLELAYSFDLYAWEYEEEIKISGKGGAVIPGYNLKGQQVLYFVDGNLHVAYSKDRIHWKVIAKNIIKRKIKTIEIIMPTKEGLLLVYSQYKKNRYSICVALFDSNDPTHLLWEPQKPLWEQPLDWDKKIEPIGAVILRGKIIGYWNTKDGIFASIYGLYSTSDGHSSKDISLQLTRHRKNPIITPDEKHEWEAFNTFNPAAIYEDGKVHILYRAQGYDYVSAIGYATSSDGVQIDERFDAPIYSPRESFEWVSTNPINTSLQYVSGGGYGGCEDPRITKIDNRYYMTYVAFDGYNPPRVALTSIAAEDFLQKKWEWNRPVLISSPGVVDKSAVIFPEKIQGKYVIMHRIYPNILIDFVDNLDFDGKTWLKGEYKISPRTDRWDSRKIGAGAPPIKTKYGWLLIYQSVGEQDGSKYKMGAMLLDLADPTKVLYRSQSPILEPDASYENNGFKSGVIYPCGAVVRESTLYVYYGGADSYVCVATADLNDFLNELRFSKITKFSTPIMKAIQL